MPWPGPPYNLGTGSLRRGSDIPKSITTGRPSYIAQLPAWKSHQEMGAKQQITKPAMPMPAMPGMGGPSGPGPCTIEISLRRSIKLLEDPPCSALSLKLPKSHGAPTRLF